MMGPYYSGSSDSIGLYGSSSSFGGTYFEWFIFQVADLQPATPTGGSWNFAANTNTPPAGWSSTPPSNPTNTVWVSISIVSSKSTAPLTWSVPGKFAYASGLQIIYGNGVPGPGVGQSNQLYIQLDTVPQTLWYKDAGTWVYLSGGILPVTYGGTGVTTSTGTGSVVLSISPTLVTPALGTPSSGVVTNLTGTASININGTVGATTANTGAFTTMTASADSSFTSTGAVQLSSGTTGQRPIGAAGKLRFNTTTTEFEGYNGTAWASVGGSTITNDTITAANLYPLFASSTTGTAANVYTSNAQYLFKPSTGELSVKAPRASNGIVVNSATITSDYTIATGDNGMSAGPITVNGGVTITVSSGSVWTVV
jgi:hypothetical protein